VVGPIAAAPRAAPKTFTRSGALALVWEGKPRLIHLPAALAEEARRRVQLHGRFQELEARILQINLRRLLRKKQVLRSQDGAL